METLGNTMIYYNRVVCLMVMKYFKSIRITHSYYTFDVEALNFKTYS